jgi:hypothetical protein
MNNKALKILNPFLVIVFLLQAVTGIIFVLELKPSSFIEFLGDFHKYTGLLLIALIIFHLIFNWGWVKINMLNKKPVSSQTAVKPN